LRVSLFKALLFVSTGQTLHGGGLSGRLPYRHSERRGAGQAGTTPGQCFCKPAFWKPEPN